MGRIANPIVVQLRQIALITAVAALAGALVALLILKLGVLGHFIDSPDMAKDYFVALLWAMGIGAYIIVLPVSQQERKDLILFWGIRCAVTLVAMLFYESHYPLDAYGYWDLARLPVLSDDLCTPGFGNGTDNTIYLTWFLNRYLPLFGSYHGLKVIYSFIGFMGCYFAYLGFAPFCERNRRKLLFLMFLFPSILFWSSILGKDPLVYFGITLYVFGTTRLLLGKSFVYVIPTALGILIAAAFRSWYLPILVLPLASLGYNGIKKPFYRLTFLALIAAAAYHSIQVFADQFQVGSAADLVAQTQGLSRTGAYGGSSHLAPQFTSIGGVLRFAPIGMFAALFRPLPGEIMNLFGLAAGIENAVVLYFVIRCLMRYRSLRAKLREPVATWALTLILFWGLMYGFISYQNLGGGVRFKLQVLPVMVGLLFYLLTSETSETGRDHVRHRGLS